MPRGYQSILDVKITFQKYKNVDIEVERKDGLILIRELAAEVKNMMDFKMGAVMVSEKIAFFRKNNILYFISV